MSRERTTSCEAASLRATQASNTIATTISNPTGIHPNCGTLGEISNTSGTATSTTGMSHRYRSCSRIGPPSSAMVIASVSKTEAHSSDEK